MYLYISSIYVCNLPKERFILTIWLTQLWGLVFVKCAILPSRLDMQVRVNVAVLSPKLLSGKTHQKFRQFFFCYSVEEESLLQ